MTKRTPPFSAEVRERAVRMVQDHQGEHRSRHAAIGSIASKIGCSGETLRDWIKEAESSKGAGPGPAPDEHIELPEVTPLVEQHRRLAVVCPGCQARDAPQAVG